MKELTIEDKAKRYDEAIAKGRQIQNTPYTAHWDTMKGVVEHLFPELKESEDEKIRNGIIKYLEQSQFGEEHYQIDDDIVREYIFWLEKQQGDKAEYNPYKATVESIAEMCKKYSTSTDLHDFYYNVKVKCKDAFEYDKTWFKKQGEQKPTKKE